jgi:hypothetical protein
MLNKLILALLLGFVSSSNLLATDLVIVCASKGNENCVGTGLFPCMYKHCTNPGANTCSDVESDFLTGVYNSHTPVPPGAPGKDWLTFTGQTICWQARECYATCASRQGSEDLWCQSDYENPWTPLTVKATFDLTHDCIGPDEGGEN